MKRKVLDISRDVEKYLCMTQVCLDVALGGLEAEHGSRRAALDAWRGMERAASRRRNERSIVRWNHGGRR